ncbi:MAG: hypothetical protein R3E96_13135 [Planctomycetota bacterium]
MALLECKILTVPVINSASGRRRHRRPPGGFTEEEVKQLLNEARQSN